MNSGNATLVASADRPQRSWGSDAGRQGVSCRFNGGLSEFGFWSEGGWQQPELIAHAKFGGTE